MGTTRHGSFEAFWERVHQATGLDSQAALAAVLGIGRAAISLAKKKDKVPDRWILHLAGRYGVSADWLATGRGEMRLGGGETSEYDQVPKVEARLSAGGGSFEDGGEVAGYYAFRADWIRRKGDPTCMVLMDVVGNSMEPELRDGDTVLVDLSRKEVMAGAVYAVGVEDVVMVKRLEKLPGRLVLRSDNTDYAPIHLQGDELGTVRVIGKVIWSSREYR